MLAFGFLTHVSLELLGFVSPWHGKSSGLKSPVTVAADPLATIGAVSAAASLFELCSKKVAQFEAEVTQFPELSKAGDKEVETHAKSLCGLVERAEQSIIPDIQQRLPEWPVQGTNFQELMTTVLNDQNTMGLSVAHAESGAGKSVAVALALTKYIPTTQAVTVLLKGPFYDSLRRFLRIKSVRLAFRVAGSLFTLLQEKGIRLQIVLDNTFDGGLRSDSEQGQLLLHLARDAFEKGHHFIVITQSKEGARQIADLNGDRTREVEQEDARLYRWQMAEAREFLINNSLRFRQEEGEEILNMSEVPDTFGGWRPVSISERMALEVL